MRLRPLSVLLAVTLSLAATACGGDDDDSGSSPEGPAGGESPRIVVGSKLDTEAQLLGELMAQVLEAQGYDVGRKIPLGGTDIVRKALENGDIDIYWEFTGTGLTTLGEAPIGDPVAAYEKVRELDAANGVTWMAAADMNDTYALAVKDSGPVAATTLTELAGDLEDEPGTRLCVDPEGGIRDDVLPLLESGYGMTFGEPVQLGNELVAAAVAEGDCQVGIVYSTAALIVKNDLRVLTDDKSVFGAYTPAPNVLTERLTRWPDLADQLAELTAALTTPAITRLNARVDVDGEEVEAVAAEFLTEAGVALRRLTGRFAR